MLSVFTILFLVLLVVMFGVIVFNFTRQSIPRTTAKFVKFQLTYLVPYLFMTISDWLQGPYVYALYDAYGFSIGQIGVLFIFGFGASMTMGTFVGSLSDRFGRRLSCLVYAVFYIIGCLTKHSHNFWIQIVGRIFGGTATSILFSSFEAWMVSEHFDREFDSNWLGWTFSLQFFLNGLVAIVAGLFAQVVTSMFDSKVAPFDLAVVFLVIGIVLILALWKENYGDASAGMLESFGEGWRVLMTDRATLWLGIAQSTFEAGMYIFVFMWTPALDVAFDDYDHGMIFAIYMVVVMIGSMTFNYLDSSKVGLERVLFVVFICGLVALALPVVFLPFGWVVFAGFNLFEMCVGIFWPAISTLKSSYIPENVRSTVMNYFRVPTNAAVFGILFFIDMLPFRVVFALCSGLVTISLLSMFMILRFHLKTDSGEEEGEVDDEEGEVKPAEEVEAKVSVGQPIQSDPVKIEG